MLVHVKERGKGGKGKGTYLSEGGAGGGEVEGVRTAVVRDAMRGHGRDRIHISERHHWEETHIYEQHGWGATVWVRMPALASAVGWCRHRWHRWHGAVRGQTDRAKRTGGVQLMAVAVAVSAVVHCRRVVPKEACGPLFAVAAIDEALG